MAGKVVIVTGANTGIGFEVTRVLCEKGYEVVMACRSEERANRAIEKLKLKLPEAAVTYMNLDLASLESVRKFVDDFHTSGKKLNVLVNNAGLGLNFKETKRQYTAENFELTMGTNHLGHFLLTNLLLDDLKKTASGEDGEARVVVVSSSLHDPEQHKKRFGPIQPFDLDNLLLFNEGTYNGFQAYKNSKIANIMFTYELSRKLDGTNVRVNALCPGFVPSTDFMRSASRAHKFVARYILRFTKVTRTVQQAANSIVSLATDEKYKEVTGKFFRDGQEAKSSEDTLDEAKQQKLWNLSGGYTKLEGFEPIEVVRPVEEEKSEKPVEANGDAAKNGDATKTEEGDDKPKEAITEVNGVEKKEEEETKKEAEEVKQAPEEIKQAPEETKQTPEENKADTPAAEESKENTTEEKKEVEETEKVKEEEQKEPEPAAAAAAEEVKSESTEQPTEVPASTE